MEENTATTQAAPTAANLFQHAAKFGAIVGLAAIFVVAIFYVIDPSILATLKLLGLIIVISMGLVVYAGINYRNSVGGYLPFGWAYLHGLSCLVVSGLIGLIFNIVLYQVIDPDLPATLTDTIIQNTEEMMANFGAPQDKIDETIDTMREELPNQFSIGGQFIGYAKALIWYAVFTLITALIVRKNEPVEI